MYIEFNDYNDALFNIRARSLNNLVYWLAQIIGSISIGFLLDQNHISRRTRAFLGWSILLVMVFAVHVWAYYYQKWVYRRFSLRACRSEELTNKPDNTPECRFLQIHRSSTSSVPDTQQSCGYISFVASLMPCGRQRLTGSWVPCRMIHQSWPTLQASVRSPILYEF